MMKAASFHIGSRLIADDQPAYIIAELSANHNQSFEEAVRLVRAAKEAGADAVKLQTYTPDTMTIASSRPEFQVGGGTIWDGKQLYDLYAEAYTPWEWQPKLKRLADELQIDLFSTPFDATAVDFLEAMEVPAHKVASFELTDLPLLRKIARTGKPIIASTGMATLAEISDAADAIRGAGNSSLSLLKCTSAYPAKAEDMNLRTIPHLGLAFDVVPGLSDHTLGIAVPVAAAAIGARIIEKHFTMSRSVPGPDSAFSLEPAEFREMVNAVRSAEQALGRVHYGLSPKEHSMRHFRRSLYVVRDVRRGEPFTLENLRSIRPATGLPPKHLDRALASNAAMDIAAGTPLEWKHLD